MVEPVVFNLSALWPYFAWGMGAGLLLGGGFRILRNL